MNWLKNFFELTRAQGILLTLASCFIIYSYAHYYETFSSFNFTFLIIGLFALQLGANLYEDWQAVKAKLLKGERLEDIRFDSILPKARLITNGTYSIRQVRSTIMLLFIIAASVSIGFAIASAWQVLLFILAGAILALIYPVLKKCYLSEVVYGLIYGPLVIMGGFYALTGYLNGDLFLLSLSMFFATTLLIHIQNIMNWEIDLRNNKNTLAILSKTKCNAMKIALLLIILAYATIVYGVWSGKFNPNTLYVFLTLPIAAKLLASMRDYIKVKDVKFKPRWYWGFFENWKNIENQGIAFFMFRFYLARNFVFFFALIAMIGSMIA